MIISSLLRLTAIAGALLISVALVNRFPSSFPQSRIPIPSSQSHSLPTLTHNTPQPTVAQPAAPTGDPTPATASHASPSVASKETVSGQTLRPKPATVHAPPSVSRASAAALTHPSVSLISPQPSVSHKADGDPVSGWKLFVDPNSAAAKQVAAWRTTRPADAAQIEKIASQSQAVWLAGTHPSATQAANTVATTLAAAQRQSAVPIFVLYAIPQRDCGGLAAGGFSATGNYLDWVHAIHNSIGNSQAIIILEPDALDGLDCLSKADQSTRYTLLRQAVGVLKQGPNTVVYLDAGNPGWKSPQTMAPRLLAAGIGQADGFALNVANFYTTAANTAFGMTLSGLVGGKHFIVDTGRNGLGPDPNKLWCNPPGRALGSPPTTHPDNPLIDALLWIKQPGYSDGACRNSAVGYGWWPDYALGLAQRASWGDSSAHPTTTLTPAPVSAPSPKPSPTAISSTGYGAQVISQNGSPYLTPGSSYHFTVSFTNTGSTSWAPATVSLATANPRDRASQFQTLDIVHHYPSGWTSPTRISLSQASVAVGTTGSFGFWYSVPQGLPTGGYTEAFQLVAGNQPFGPIITWEITIR